MEGVFYGQALTGLRVLKFDGAVAPRVLKFDSGYAAEGCGRARSRGAAGIGDRDRGSGSPAGQQSSGVGQPTIGRPFYVQAKGQLRLTWRPSAGSPQSEGSWYTPIVNHLSINTSRRGGAFLYSRRGLRLRRRGAYSPVLTHGLRVVFAPLRGPPIGGQDRDGASYRCSAPYTLLPLRGISPQGETRDMREKNSESYTSGTIPVCPPLVAGATTLPGGKHVI